jgi:hypothetical protein
MVALDVPPSADLFRIRTLLEHGESEGWRHCGVETAADPGDETFRQFREARARVPARTPRG